MLIKQKKTCNRCIVYRDVETNGPTGEICSLGYKIKTVGVEQHAARCWGVPQEPCPKPKTQSDYFYADKWYKKKG